LPVIEGARIIPFDDFNEMIRGLEGELFGTLPLLRDAVNGHVFHMESLPPFRHDTIPPGTGWTKQDGGPNEVSPPYLRLKAWRVHRAQVMRFCAEQAIPYVASPTEALDEDGFLRQEFLASPAHANVKYGALVRRQILARL
jgi:hypothetical protein